MGRRRQIIETEEQKTAFRIYYEMGSERSLSQLARTVGANRATIAAWAKKWKWDQRLSLVQDDLAVQTSRQLVKPAATAIGEMMNNIELLLNGVFKQYQMGANPIEIRSASDVKSLIEAYLKLKAVADPKEAEERAEEDRENTLQRIMEDKDAKEMLMHLKDSISAKRAKDVTPAVEDVVDAEIVSTGDDDEDWDNFLKSLPEDKREKFDDMMEAAP